MSQIKSHVLFKIERSKSYISFDFSRGVLPLILIMLLSLASILSGIGLTSGSDPWSQWRGSVDHIGVSIANVPENDTLIWKYKTDAQIWPSPVFYNDAVLIGSDDNKLYCFKSGNGELLWKFATNRSIQATPLIIDNRVYFGSLDSMFYCLELPESTDEPHEPEEVWRYDCGSSIVSSAHAYDNSVLFGCKDGYLYRLTFSGDLIWRVEIGTDIEASPLIDEVNGRVYIGAIDGDFSCIDLSDGNVTWTAYGGEIYSSGCLWNDIIYLCGGNIGILYAFNSDNGSIIWEFHIGRPAYSTPSIDDGKVFFGAWEYAWCLPAVDPNGDGEINKSEVIWSTPTYDVQGGSSPLVTDQYIYIGSDDGNLYCLDRETGSVIWNYTTNGYIYSSPALYNGAIYFGSCDSNMYCIGDIIQGLRVELEAGVEEIRTNETLQINITVSDQNGTVEGAAINIVLSAGDIEVISGNEVGDQIFTGPDGRVELLFKPPPVSSRSTIEIKVTAEMPGVQLGGSIIYIIVEPGKGESTGEEPEGFIDPNEKRRPFYIILTFLIIIDVVLAIGILKIRSSRAENKTMKIANDKGGKIDEHS